MLPRITKAEAAAAAARLSPAASAVFKTVEHRRRHGDADVRRVVERVAAAEAAGAIGPWAQVRARARFVD